MKLWDFDGLTYEPSRDGERLGAQLRKVRMMMMDGAWHTLAELAEYAYCSEASASARIRDLRKKRFGGYTIEREYVSHGLWHYRMVQP